MTEKDTAGKAGKPKLSLLAAGSVAAGFPSPADDYLEGELDLNRFLVKRPAATFFVRVSGESMQDAGIFSGDILVVDRSLTARDNSIVVAVVDGEFTVKRLKLNGNKIVLMPENSAYSPIEVEGDEELIIWGVVTSSIRNFQN